MSEDLTMGEPTDIAADFPESESDFTPEERQQVLSEIDAEAQKNRALVVKRLRHDECFVRG